MKIGHYDSELWEQGGVATYMKRIGAAQQKLGHEVFYFSWFPPPERIVEFEPFIPVRNTTELFTKAEFLNLDILHVHKAITPPLPIKLPIIRTLHGHHPYCPGGGRYLNRWQRPCDRAYHPLGCLWGAVIDRCSSVRPHRIQDNYHHLNIEQATLPHVPVLAVSEFLKRQMVRSGYPTESIQVLHHFAPNLGIRTPPRQDKTPRFLFIGRITLEKGIDWLLRALQFVKTPIHLDIAGDGEKSTEMHLLLDRLGIRDRVTFHGWVDAQQVAELITVSRAVIFPSVWHEPAGLVAFEAMSNSRAVIASQVGGIPEIVQDGVNGLLVEPWSIEQLSRKIELLATDWQLAYKLGEAGRHLVETCFTEQKHLDFLMNAYQKTIDKKHQLIS